MTPEKVQAKIGKAAGLLDVFRNSVWYDRMTPRGQAEVDRVAKTLAEAIAEVELMALAATYSDDDVISLGGTDDDPWDIEESVSAIERMGP